MRQILFVHLSPYSTFFDRIIPDPGPPCVDHDSHIVRKPRVKSLRSIHNLAQHRNKSTNGKHCMNIAANSNPKNHESSKDPIAWDLKLDELRLTNYELPKHLDIPNLNETLDPIIQSGILLRDLNQCHTDILDLEYKSIPLFTPPLQLWSCNIAHTPDIFTHIPHHSLYNDLQLLLPFTTPPPFCLNNLWTFQSSYPWTPCIFPLPPPSFYQNEEPVPKRRHRRITQLCGFSDYAFYRTIGLNEWMRGYMMRIGSGGGGGDIPVVVNLCSKGEMERYLRGKMVPRVEKVSRWRKSGVVGVDEVDGMMLMGESRRVEDDDQERGTCVEFFEKFVGMFEGMKVYRMRCEVCFPTPVFMVGRSPNGNIIGLMSAGVFT